MAALTPLSRELVPARLLSELMALASGNSSVYAVMLTLPVLVTVLPGPTRARAVLVKMAALMAAPRPNWLVCVEEDAFLMPSRPRAEENSDPTAESGLKLPDVSSLVKMVLPTVADAAESFRSVLMSAETVTEPAVALP